MEVESETASKAQTIERTRCLDGKLLIDRLLELAGIQNDESWLYPPQTEMQQASLMRMVEESNIFQTLERNCLKFYLYLDQSREAALEFARESCLPKSFVKSTTGYWQLDHVQIEAGVKALSYPGVVPDFLPSILHLLSVSPKDLVAFVRQARISLDSTSAIQAVVEAFVRVGDPSEALRWARTTGTIHAELVRVVLSTALGANQTGVIIKSAMQALLNAPFDEFEDSIALAYAEKPPADMKAANRDMLAEWILTRLIAQGRYIEASKLVDSPSLKPSDNQAARKRALLKKGLFSIMSELDTSILETEQQEPEPMTNGVDHQMEEGSAVAQHPWAPPSAPAEKAPDNRNIPLSASPAFRASGDSRAIKHVVEALRLGSPMRKTSFGTPHSPRPASPMGSPYSGSPFIPRVQDKQVNRTTNSNYGSPAPQKSLPAQMRLQRDLAYQPQSRPASPAQGSQSPYPRDRSPAPLQQQQPTSSKRSAPEPRSRANRQKMRAVEMEVDEEADAGKEQPDQQEKEPKEKPATPSRKVLPGAFGSTSDNEEEAPAPAPEPGAEMEEEEDEVPEMRQVKNSSPVSKASTSSRKPRHVRGTAPEPPTPAQPIRRSKRISAASREQSREPISPPPPMKKPGRAKKASGRSKRAGSVASDISEAQ